MLHFDSEDEQESDVDDDESDGYGSSSKMYSSKISETFNNSDYECKKRKFEDINCSEVNRLNGLIEFEQCIYDRIVNQRRITDLNEEKEFLTKLEDILIEGKDMIDLTADSNSESDTSSESADNENPNSKENSKDPENDEILTPLAYDKDKMREISGIMNIMGGEIFINRQTNYDDSDDEDDESGELAFLDSGCSRTSLRSRNHFTKVLISNGKSVNTVNGKIHVKYEGPTVEAPFENAHWIPELRNNLISIGDLVNLGMSIIIKPSGMMYGNHGKKNIFAVMMKNNVWTMDTKRLFKRLKMVSKPKYNGRIKVNMMHAKMLNSNKNEKYVKENTEKLNLLHKRMFHRGKGMIIRDYNKGLFNVELFKGVDKLDQSFIDKQKCSCCETAKSCLMPSLLKEGGRIQSYL